MSDTPETDNALELYYETSTLNFSGNSGMDIIEFARELERDRNAWKAKAERWFELSEAWRFGAVERIEYSDKLLTALKNIVAEAEKWEGGER